MQITLLLSFKFGNTIQSIKSNLEGSFINLGILTIERPTYISAHRACSFKRLSKRWPYPQAYFMRLSSISFNQSSDVTIGFNYFIGQCAIFSSFFFNSRRQERCLSELSPSVGRRERGIKRRMQETEVASYFFKHFIFTSMITMCITKHCILSPLIIINLLSHG